MKYDIIIIGAGASGLMAAITAARNGSSCLVIEHQDRIGKKIFATGNGKCNFSNLVQEPECYRSEDSSFAMKVLSKFNVQQTITFFEELGIYPKERMGYLYPNSEQAASIVQVLDMECRRLGVTFALNEKVIGIKDPDFTVITERKIHAEPDGKGKAEKGKRSRQAQSKKSNKATITNASITMETKSYYAKKLILATGGCASPKLGSDGSGYPLAKHFGHKIIKPLPALVQLKSSEKYCKTLSGVRTIGLVSAYTGSVLLSKEMGEMIFTDYGISGIPIMQISRFVAKALDQQKKVYLKIDFLPSRSLVEVIQILQNRLRHDTTKNIEEMMIGLFNHKLSYILIKQAGLDPEKNVGKMSKRDMESLAQQIKSFSMDITDTNNFEYAQVSAGGVATSQLDEETMESKLRKNLYIIGELADVDGTCGGYNLQWAWSSGYVAGVSASTRKEQV
ncbi:MAG: NAD(P)/FAD-dependent oxidoreductase [Clostridiales bacterium]|nr:NAD(P)/FAD-dependent oxidoreductase [Clostridiales bacterium]